MKTTAVIWFSLFCFGINLQQGFGQTQPQLCSNPEYFFRDADGDNYGNQSYSQSDYLIARTDFIDSGSPVDGFSINGDVAYGCVRPDGFVRLSNDLNDNDLCITNISPQHFYLDNDSDG